MFAVQEVISNSVASIVWLSKPILCLFFLINIHTVVTSTLIKAALKSLGWIRTNDSFRREQDGQHWLIKETVTLCCLDFPLRSGNKFCFTPEGTKTMQRCCCPLWRHKTPCRGTKRQIKLFFFFLNPPQSNYYHEGTHPACVFSAVHPVMRTSVSPLHSPMFPHFQHQYDQSDRRSPPTLNDCAAVVFTTPSTWGKKRVFTKEDFYWADLTQCPSGLGSRKNTARMCYIKTCTHVPGMGVIKLLSLA